MLGYYLRLALLSFRRTPGLTALMVLAIGVGIGVCVVSLTVFHTMSGNPIWWKSDRLFTVTLDNWDPTTPADPKRPDLPPPQLTFRDAKALHQSGIPERSVIMFRSGGVISAADSAAFRPRPASARVTTGDFFAMFEVPFRFGGGWPATADSASEPVIVLTEKMNDILFGGENSVGRTLRWNDQEFRIIGVTGPWQPRPRYYDLNQGHFDPAEDVFIPWGVAEARGFTSAGSTNCWKAEKLDTDEAFLNSECVWIQMWVELPDSASVARMQAFMDAYWARERAAGRFQRPRNNRLTSVDQWLVDQEVVTNDNRILVGLAFAFLAVCLINTVGLLLAKFLSVAPIAGIRRALGASRRALFTQHFVEVGVIAATGALLGLGLGALGLYAVRILYTSADPRRGGYEALGHFDTVSILWAAGLAVIAAVAAGLYPAWRIGRVEPARYLKNQ
jgi:putative ABC transport system permease protein